MADADLTTAGSEHLPAVVVAGTGESTITLSKDRRYRLKHLGLDADGSTAGTEAIFLRVGTDTVETNLNAATDKAALINNHEPIEIGPGVTKLYAKTAAGAPTFSIMPLPPVFGQY